MMISSKCAIYYIYYLHRQESLEINLVKKKIMVRINPALDEHSKRSLISVDAAFMWRMTWNSVTFHVYALIVLWRVAIEWQLIIIILSPSQSISGFAIEAS